MLRSDHFYIFWQSISDIAGYIYSITNSFIEIGNKINEEKFSDEYKIPHWYFISNIEIVSISPFKGAVCLLDSITDWRFSSIDKPERWLNFLFKKCKMKKLI